MASPIENRIAAQKRRIAALDDRIGRLMSRRVDEEEDLARLYAQERAALSKAQGGAK